jgi:hypothetical protein
MTTEALLALSTRLAHDLTAWSEEVTRRDAIAPEQLRVLREAAEIIERATVTASPAAAIDAAHASATEPEDLPVPRTDSDLPEGPTPS